MATITTRKLDNVLNFGANTTASTQTLDLPRNKFIRRVRLLAEAVVSTVGSGVNADFLRRVLSNISVRADGNTNYFNISGEDLYQVNMRDYSTNILCQDWPSGTGTIRMEGILDFAINKSDDSDMSALLPAFLFNTIELAVTSVTTATAAGGSGSPATSAITISVIVEEVQMSPNEANEMYGENYAGLRKVFNTVRTVSVAAANSNFGGRIDLQVGYVIQDILFRTTDGSPVINTDNLFTSYLIKQFGAPGDFDIEREDFYTAQYRDVHEFGLTSLAAIAGTFMFNPARKLGGLNAIALKQGDLTFNYNNTDTSFTAYVTTRVIA